MDIETLKYILTGIIIFFAALFIFFEKFFAYRKDQKIFRDGFFTDMIWYNIFQTYILGILISHLIVYIDTNYPGLRFHFLSGWPIWAQVTLFIVTHDFYIYWFHRWMHHNKYLWRLHEAHHSPKDVDWLSGVRSHSLEIFINQTIEFLPITLLGAAPEVALYKGAISAVWGMYIHSNINVSTGILQFIINGPEMHRWHHANTTDVYYKNMATKLAVWDWIFETAYFPKDKKPDSYGLNYTFPKNYLTQHLFAFRGFK